SLTQPSPTPLLDSVVGRLIRFWDSRNINKNGEFMGMTIFLLDELVRIVSNLLPWTW
ncbi:hypothetical protein HID58_034481, partial [Brassica napus]